MDLRLTSGPPTEAERAALEFIAAPRRDLLLPALHALDDAVGWLSPQGIDEIARRLDVAPAEIYGVASFYSAFSFEPRPLRNVQVCTDITCTLRGGAAPGAGERGVNCIGQCDRAPARLVMDGSRLADQTGSETGSKPGSETGSELRTRAVGDRLLRRVGTVDPTSLAAYCAAGGYTAWRQAVSIGPQGVIDALDAAGLSGRGGAAFPTGRKWAAVAGQPALPHYVICNADESEPGTFKDRVLLEGDPFAVIEAMTIAGFATGSARGFVYLRHEYPHAAAALDRAIGQARAAGLLGEDVDGTGFGFDVEVRRGAGAYICGEETALCNSIEGYRGEPRPKPPFPVEIGLFGRPTVINNVETLLNVSPILTGDRRDTKLFSVSGDVVAPGVYEVPTGIPLGELLSLAGAGAGAGAGELAAVLLGGAAGSFATVEDLDVPLSLDGARNAGLTLGSGAVIVLGPTADLGAVILRIAEFFADESCGQCVPCRVGTVRQREIVERLAHHLGQRPVAGDLSLLGDVGRVIRDASICGLGQTAANAIESAVARLGLFSGAPGKPS